MIHTEPPLFINKKTGNIQEFTGGDTFDLSDIFVNQIDVGILTTRKLNVGVGGTIITAGYGSSVGIGTTNPTRTFDVNGGIRVRGALYDKDNQEGTSGQLLVSTGTGVDWQDASGISGGISVRYNNINIGTGITSLNFSGAGISSVTSNISGISTITVDLQSNLDGGSPDTNYGGIDAIEGGSV